MADEIDYHAISLCNDETFTIDVVNDDIQTSIDCSCMNADEDACFCPDFGGATIIQQAWIEKLLQAEYVIFDCGTSTRNI